VGVGTVGCQPELAGSLGHSGQAAPLHDAPEVQRAEPGAGDCRCDDPDDWAGGGCVPIAKTSAAMDATGMETTTASAHFKAGRADAAEIGESVHHCPVREFAAVESGVGLGAGNDKSQAKE